MKQDIETFEQFIQKQGKTFAATALVMFGIAVVSGLVGYAAYDPDSRGSVSPVLMILGVVLTLVAIAIFLHSLFLQKRCQKLIKTLAENPVEVVRFWVTEITTRGNGIDLNRRRDLSVQLADGKTVTFTTAVVWSKLGGDVDDKITPELLGVLSRLAPHARPPINDRWVVS